MTDIIETILPLMWPSKKIIPILIACIVFVGLIVYAVISTNKAPRSNIASLKNIATAPVSAEIQKQALEKDTDGDGLKDWEETLWHTDPKISDTDGDGTSDGDEVKAGRNPTVKGPKDKLDEVPLNSQTTASNKDNPTTPTATTRAAQDLFATYMNLKKSGAEVTPDVQNQIAEQLINTTSSSLGSAKQYDLTNIKLVNDSDSAITAYGNRMGEIILANNPGTDNELIILEKTVDSQDRKDMADLDIIIASYKKMLSDSLGVSVPRSAGAIHISIINDFSKILNSVENFKKVFDDPIATLAAVKQYQETSADLAAAMKAATLYFSNRGIEYDRSQSGYAFTHALGQ